MQAQVPSDALCNHHRQSGTVGEAGSGLWSMGTIFLP